MDVAIFWIGLLTPAFIWCQAPRLRQRPHTPPHVLLPPPAVASLADPPTPTPPHPHPRAAAPFPRFIFGVGSVFRLSFDWLLLIAIALALSGANIVGYVRCKQEAGTRLMSGLQGVMGRAGMGSNVMGQALQSAAGKAFGL